MGSRQEYNQARYAEKKQIADAIRLLKEQNPERYAELVSMADKPAKVFTPMPVIVGGKKTSLDNHNLCPDCGQLLHLYDALHQSKGDEDYDDWLRMWRCKNCKAKFTSAELISTYNSRVALEAL